MPRIQPVDPSTTDPKTRQQLEGVERSLGVLPNMLTTLAQSPAALGGYLGFSQALGASGKLGAGVREQIALAVAGANACGYCASAHTQLGKGAGVDDAELGRAIRAESQDPKIRAALTFARSVVAKRGFVDDAEVETLRGAGYSDGEILEIVANVVLNILTNYVNHIAQTEIDFPVVEVGEPVAA